MNAPLNLQTPLSAEQTRARLGQITRQLHEAIVQLGLDTPLQAIAEQIPDARERLEYVGQMTERAAHKVLGLVEEAQPACKQWQSSSTDAQQAVQAALANPDTPPDVLRAALQQAAQSLAQSAAAAAQQHQVLGDIMMTQDFQDLSGQVIKKVIRIISDTESSLLSLLVESDPSAPVLPQREPPPPAALEGPQTPDKAMAQGDVDDLLASMGF
jgi:chemotaxis protein CheZ